jgi:hypothetical protein
VARAVTDAAYRQSRRDIVNRHMLAASLAGTSHAGLNLTLLCRREEGLTRATRKSTKVLPDCTG